MSDQVASAIQSDLVVGQRGAGFVEIVLGLLDFLGTRAVLQFLKISPGVLRRAARLLVLGAEFVVFEANQNLAFFNLVTFFDADPLHSARDLGIQIDLVMSHNVAAGGEHYAADIGCFLRRSANHFHFRSVVRKQAIGDRDQAQQHHQPDPDEDVAARPDGRFAFAAGARVAINAQALQIFVFSVNRHIVSICSVRRLAAGILLVLRD